MAQWEGSLPRARYNSAKSLGQGEIERIVSYIDVHLKAAPPSPNYNVGFEGIF